SRDEQWNRVALEAGLRFPKGTCRRHEPASVRVSGKETTFGDKQVATLQPGLGGHPFTEVSGFVEYQERPRGTFGEQEPTQEAGRPVVKPGCRDPAEFEASSGFHHVQATIAASLEILPALRHLRRGLCIHPD